MFPSKRNRSFAAEWDPQDGILISWPNAGTDWAYMLDEVTACYVEIARAILQDDERLIIVANDPEEVRSALEPDTDWRRVTIAVMPINDTWVRDYGPITVYHDGQLSLANFTFNAWGMKFAADCDNQVNSRLDEQCAFKMPLLNYQDLVLEGGSIETDGNGTVMTTTCCLTAPNRNDTLTREQLEKVLLERLGCLKMLWLDHGSLVGDDTDGHIDTLMRICPDDTILYTGGDADHPDLALMEQELHGLRTLDGRPYRLLKLPLPHPIYEEVKSEKRKVKRERLPATYANYLVINGAVLVPTYAQPDLDAEALHIIAQAFPDREIVGIDCRAVIRQHGSLHCCTMQYY